ncbi:hypothetical protein ILUMI_09036 [Ignelater luminosus]|uniref:Uncharacterized protein n=1 Tax=Ignelater luminosus TaxID=2038154 RepID=A0A8K0D5T7_IGNLU|nr:hypothetical protein ILUMI_09036 [Ignelater luminosus]
MTNRLLLLSRHSAFFLICASISIPRLIYFLRCSPTWRKMSLFEKYDAKLKSSLEAILNISLSRDVWLQSSLLVKIGGLGKTVPFAASNLYGKHTLFDLTISTNTAEDKARLLAAQCMTSGCWLNALPFPQLGTHMFGQTFRISVVIRLGAVVCQPYRCPCGAAVSAMGLHSLACKLSRGRISRHDALNNDMLQALRTTGVPCIREPPGCSRSDGKRPDGQTLVPWTR